MLRSRVLDDAIQVHVDEVQPGRRAPVPEQARLDVLERQRLAQQRIVEQVDLADREIVGRAPPGVDLREGFVGEICRGRGGICAHVPIIVLSDERWVRG